MGKELLSFLFPENLAKLFKVNDRMKLLFVKWIHTLVWMGFVSCILFVLWSGITGEITTCSWIAAGAVSCEGIILLVFKGFCPLTKIARKYSNSASYNFDIFLPVWIARYNKQIFTPLFLTGLVLMVYKYFVA